MYRRLICAIAALQMMSVAAHASVSCYGEASVAKNITATEVDTAIGSVTIQADGWQVAPGIGCDFKQGGWVLGLWGRYDFTDVDGDLFATSLSANDYWSAGGRAGYHINDGTLLYGMLGLARSDLEFAGVEQGRQGTLYGAGLEIDMSGLGMPNVVGFVEWNRIDWKDRGFPGATLETSSDVVRTGVRIRFDVLK